MQILLTEAEHDKLKSAAEGGELRAQELFKAAMQVYRTNFETSLNKASADNAWRDRVSIFAVLEAHRSAFDLAKNHLLPEIKS